MPNYKRIFLMVFLVITFLFSIGSAGFTGELKIITIQHWPIINWEPARVFSYGSRPLSNIYETLLYMDLSEGEANLIPRLAASYERSEDGKVWTFKLRKGVKFHNGEPFNAESVKFSFDYYKRVNKGGCFIWESVREAKVIDDHTVQFICDEPAPVDLIVSAQYAAYMLPPKLYKDKELEWFQKGQAVGTGPYKLAAWEKGVHIILEKNDEYWGGWKPNRFDKAIFKVVEDPTTRMQLLKQGTIDMIEEIPVEFLPEHGGDISQCDHPRF
jgi:peptide/nickel transport system substrate-binding protein